MKTNTYMEKKQTIDYSLLAKDFSIFIDTSSIMRPQAQDLVGVSVSEIEMRKIPQLTVNWHLLEACNYKCYYCYAKYAQKSNFSSDYEKVLRELSGLTETPLTFKGQNVVTAESIRINFAGGEPFLAKDLSKAISLAYDLGLQPSFISNGSLISTEFIKKYGHMISVAGFSIDSLDQETNAVIGRQTNRSAQMTLERMKTIFSLFREYAPQTVLKINTVVCSENFDADLSPMLEELRPDRWKALQVIPIHGATDRGITDEQYKKFLARHSGLIEKTVREDNDHMHRSYLMLDPNACFYQRNGSLYLRSKSIVDVGAKSALQNVEFDVETYSTRYS